MEVSESSFILKSDDLTSVDAKTINNSINNQDGGCFSSYSCSEINSILLQAFTSKKPDVVCFLLENLKTNIDKLDVKDKHDRNFLHYFVLYNNYEVINQYLIKILKNKDICSVRDAINVQDILGNTPLHYAVLIGNNTIINLLDERGAKKKIKNNEGTFIDTEDHLHEQTQTQIDRDSIREDSIRKVDVVGDSDNENDIFISDVKINNLKELSKLENRDITESFIFNPSTMRNTTTRYTVVDDIATDDIANAIILKMRGGTEIPEIPPTELGSPKSEPLQMVAEIDMKDKNSDNNRDSETVNTEKIIQALKETNPQKGGKSKHENKSSKHKNKSKGNRKLITYSEFSFGNVGNEGVYGEPIKTDEDFTAATEHIGLELLKLNAKKAENTETEEKTETEDKTLEKKLFDKTETTETDDKSEKEETSESTEKEEKIEKSGEKPEDTVEVQSELSEMARSIARQSTEIHERVIKKIAEILKLDLNNPEDNKKARYYKAAIWREITNKHPELSNFDRAVEMEKKVTKDYLKTIDINKVTKEIDEYFSEKESTPKEEKKEKKEKKTERVKSKKSKSSSKKSKKSKKSKSNKLNGGSLDSDSLSISTESNIVYSSTSEF